MKADLDAGHHVGDPEEPVVVEDDGRGPVPSGLQVEGELFDVAEPNAVGGPSGKLTCAHRHAHDARSVRLHVRFSNDGEIGRLTADDIE